MAGLNDDENSDGAAVTSPPRLVNVHKQLVEGDEQDLTSTLTKTLNQDEDEATSTDASTTLPASPMSSATISSTSSNIRAVIDSQSNHTKYAGENSSIDIDDGIKSMQVKITVLSLQGIVAKKKNASTIPTNKLKRRGHDKKKADNEEATIVASFSQNISKEKVFLTHVPSLPVPLTSGPAYSSAASSSVSVSSFSSGNGGGKMLQPVVHWPGTDDKDAEAGNALSTLQFKRQFVREEGGRARFVPQTCPINLSISRNGKMALLGKVNLVINGEERGESSVTVPITSSIRSSKSTVGNPLKQAKKISSSLAAAAAKGKQVKQQDTPMIKIKGDVFQFGLEGGAMLRVLVHVNDLDAAIMEEEEISIVKEEEMSHNEDDACSVIKQRDDDSYSDNDEDDSRGDCLSIEGEDSSLLDQDDYMNMNHYMMENNELYTLRQQLANSDQTNKILEMELANAQHTAQMQYQEENDRLRVGLKKLACMQANEILQMEQRLQVEQLNNNARHATAQMQHQEENERLRVELKEATAEGGNGRLRDELKQTNANAEILLNAQMQYRDENEQLRKPSWDTTGYRL
mmetsp:Transcript_39076/g.70399  ORF Transcript_39076/g.70399 Transcript_39076/m.70399 type:complete len:574 (+) Transcript_39076:263-1984(+)